MSIKGWEWNEERLEFHDSTIHVDDDDDVCVEREVDLGGAGRYPIAMYIPIEVMEALLARYHKNKEPV